MIESADVSPLYLQPMDAVVQPSSTDEVLSTTEWCDVDDLFAEAHTGAADDLLMEFETSVRVQEVRSEADQRARDEIAAKALSLVISAAEGTYSEESRRFELVEQLVARIGSLCNHQHLAEALDFHFGNKQHHGHDHEEGDDDEDSSHRHSSKSYSRKSAAPALASSSLLRLQPLFADLQKILTRR